MTNVAFVRSIGLKEMEKKKLINYQTKELHQPHLKCAL
jgi:hypothetical protein